MAELGHRIMRIPLPVTLIRAMDTAILDGLGGYETRGEFIVDAIQERLLELTIDVTEDAGPPPRERLESRPMSTAKSTPSTAVVATATTQETVLTPPPNGFVVELDSDVAQPEGRSLFGLHNRDYPSLWALAKLASFTEEHPIPVETYYAQVIDEAWKYGELLTAIEKQSGEKRTALFPTNVEKRKPAEAGFRAFAVGDYRRQSDGAYVTSGPLFEWRVATLIPGDQDQPQIAVTAAGWSLLKALEGLSVQEPHPAPATAHFLRHLLTHAPADAAVLVEIIRAIGPDGAPRQDVLQHVTSAWPAWTENEVSTNSAGYIARAREWGLVEPKQTQGKYHLTSLGIEHAIGEN